MAGVHKPVRETAQALALGPHRIGENFREVNPDDGALGEGEKRDVADQQPDQKALVLAGEENYRDSGQTERGADGADQQQGLAAEPVDHRHCDHGEEQVGGPDRHRLQVAGDFAEAGVSKNVVQVIENRVDARELVEHSDADREENREGIFSGEQFFGGLALLDADGGDDFLQVMLVVLVAGQSAGRFGLRLRGPS